MVRLLTTKPTMENPLKLQAAPYVKSNISSCQVADILRTTQVRGVRNQNFPTKLRLRYYQDRTLSLELQYQKEDQWTECFSVDAPKIPNVTYLGFSAETGELSDNHDLISVSTKNLYATSKEGTSESVRVPGSKKSRERSGGGWGWFIFKFLMFGLVLTGGYVGFTMYRTSSRRSRF